MGHEAGHSHRRIVRADGDASGAELMRALVAAVRLRDDLEIVEHTLALDLVRAGDRIAGAVTRDPDGGRTAWLAGAVVLSTGGIGRLYRHTTNPVEATGDGLAMALRAGAAVADLEFVQFHPTALDSPLDPMPLLTEALRGEGAQLIDGNGVRYMPSVHPDAELAPRDVVARANWERREAGIPIYLDATHLGDRFAARFPTVYRLAVAAGFDPTVMPLPVSPAQHYHMGGIATDPHGRTSQPGLWACGEVSSTGLHGANRLASNSLLEGLVFAGRIAASITSSGLEPPSLRRAAVPADLADRSRQATGEIDQVRDTMWRLVGVVRSATGLREAQRRFAAARREAPAGELRTALTVAAAVADAALSRTESRGSHQRADHPAPDPAQARRSYRTPRPVPYLPVRVPTRGAA
jgi:L-aspartate oxidase